MIKLTKTDLRSSIKSQLIEIIESQGLRPGDKIMSQNELAKLFKVGAPTVCRVLTELAEDGILYRVNGKGTFIADPILIKETEQSDSEFTIGIYPFENYHGNDYLLELAEGISQGIMHHRFNCQYITRSKFEHSELSISEYMFTHQIDGIIMPGGNNNDLHLAEELSANGFPCVLINRNVEHCDTVACDHHTSATQLMEVLIGNGHQRILYVGAKSESSTEKELLAGYVDFCQHYNIYHPELIFLANLEDNQFGNNMVKYLLSLKELPTAIIVSGGYIMQQIMQPLLNSGLSIPEDLSIVTYDEPHLSPKYNRFTCAKQPLKKMGTTAVEIMNKNLKFNKNSAVQIKFAAELIHGNTVKMNRVIPVSIAKSQLQPSPTILKTATA